MHYSDADARNQMLVRMLNVLRYLSRRRYTRYELADCLLVDQRTIRRYIYAWQRAGVDVESTETNGKGGEQTRYWITDETWRLLIGREPEPEPEAGARHLRRQRQRESVAQRNVRVRARRRKTVSA